MTEPASPSPALEKTSAIVGIPIGEFVDVQKYDEIANYNSLASQSSDLKQLFVMGWVGLAYRARSAEQRAGAFQQAFPRVQSNMDHFAQNDLLFDFVAHACAAAEATVFASFIASHGLRGAEPTASDLRTPTLEMIERVSATPITADLGAALKSSFASRGRELFSLRNVLFHRGRPPIWLTVSLGSGEAKTTIPSNPAAIPKEWLPDLEMHAGALDPYITWLRAHIADAMQHLAVVLKPSA